MFHLPPAQEMRVLGHSWSSTFNDQFEPLGPDPRFGSYSCSQQVHDTYQCNSRRRRQSLEEQHDPAGRARVEIVTVGGGRNCKCNSDCKPESATTGTHGLCASPHGSGRVPRLPGAAAADIRQRQPFGSCVYLRGEAVAAARSQGLLLLRL
jgi:hypothetical protein